ncbi:HD domain-containing protein [Novosphingopyxis baekryungensis]|uniref:HD domain-containing protein n=1 Tax=Novosphingopyxis baekryungensis TaxID=279369 RepID=UPI0003B33E22|nr:HD domain-containing protein [Novosphingopyxis baekryungensis]
MSEHVLSSALIRAAVYAADRHCGQTRGDGVTPYINHPLAVASILRNDGGISDPDTLVAALLHDVVEDTNATIDEVRTLFGEGVAAIVAEVSDDTSLPREQRRREQLGKIRLMSPGGRLVKLADKIANLRDLQSSPPRDWSMDRQLAYVSFACAAVNQLRGTHAALEHIFDEVAAAGADCSSDAFEMLKMGTSCD